MTLENDEADLLYGVPAIARFMKLKDRQVRHLIDRYGLPTFPLGAKIASRKSSLNAWLAERERQARAGRAA